MKENYANRILLRMIRDMSGGAQDELSDILQELSGEMMDPQKLMEMARAMGIDLDQFGGMMGGGRSAAPSFDPYQILGLDRSASDQEVRDRYNELLHTLHPDKSRTPGTQYLLQLVMAAYEMIKKERGWQ